MILLTLAVIASNGLLGLLFEVAIACVIIWAIYALITWAGITVPQPVWIILTALFCILIIVWLFKIFGYLT